MTRRFPIQGGLTILWVAAEVAYESYARHYGGGQSLERLAARGGFGLHEFVSLYLRGDGRQVHSDTTMVRVLVEADVCRGEP